MPTSSQEAPARPATGRECDCPPWVLRCAHWEGKVLVLATEESHVLRSTCFIPQHRFGIAVGKEGGYYRCRCGGIRLTLFIEPTWCSDLMQGRAEFSRQEAILLGHEDA